MDWFPQWFRTLLRVIPVLVLIVPLFHCSQSEPERKPSPIKVFEQPEVDTTTPPWLEPSRKWPYVVNLELDSADEVTIDGLFFRIRSKVWKVFTGGPAADEHPLWFSTELTARPVPRWELIRELKMDSVVLYDPVRNAIIPTLPMLSSERDFGEGTLRTAFSSNAAVRFTVDLDEGQSLEPTLYFSWGRRTIIVKPKDIPVEFKTDVPREKPGLPEWDENG